MSGDELGTAVCAIDVEAVTRLLTGGHDPNAARAPGGEDAFQPDRPLKMVMFRLSDSMLGDAERAQLAAIARILLAHGADPAPAMAIAEYRYGAYQGKDDAATWAAWHVVAAAASPYAVAERAVIKLQSTREVILAKAGKRPSSAAEVRAIMQHYADRLALKLGGIKVLHVAGTKGKGSVCAIAESVLRAHGLRTGMFTSPHLIEYRERIRIDGRPLSPSKFAAHFWATLRALQRSAPRLDDAAFPPMPSFFRFMTLFALNTFVAERVDIIILEVGIGGRLDSTNFLPPEVVTATAVTTLDLDHCAILGDTIELIAAEKAGIFKRGVPAVSIATQCASALSVLRAAAATAGAPFEVAAPLDDAVPALGLAGAFQRDNAAVALRLCEVALGDATRSPSLPPSTLRGLASCRWAGRAQTVRGDARRFGAALDVRVHLDGAHTPLSAQCCADWFRSQSPLAAAPAARHRILIFNCGSGRDPTALLRPLLGLFDAAIFCPPDFDKPTAKADPTGEVLLSAVLGDDPAALSAALDALRAEEAAALAAIGGSAGNLDSAHSAHLWQRRLAAVWVAMGGGDAARVQTAHTVAEAFDCCRLEGERVLAACGGGAAAADAGASARATVDVLVTGSIYLVGSALAALGWSEDDEGA